MKILIMILVTICMFVDVQAQRFVNEQSTQKTFNVSNGVTVVVENIYGSITVKPSPNNQANITVKKWYKGYNQAQLDAAEKEVSVGWIERNDSLIAYTKAPFICDKWNDCKQDGKWIRNYKKYEFKFDFSIELPENANVTLSTISEGNIEISGMKGQLTANNVNGNIAIKNAHEVRKATTVDGDVVVSYDTKPSLDAYFNTISGDIKVYCSKDLNASVYSKTMNGEFFTSFDYEPLAPKVLKATHREHSKTTFKIENKTGIQIGDSTGPNLSMATLSGNMYLSSL